MTAAAAIELVGVSKRFGRRDAVVDLTLSVPAGSVCGLLGHNGAGKSTTLGMLLGQVFPDRGGVRVLGHDVFRHRSRALAKVGAIFESPAFYDYLSGWRNLVTLCAYSGVTDRRAIADVVALVGLSERIHHKVGTYSHGMRQRLALAQALLPGPELLILDEPADGLDPQGIADLRQFLVDLHRRRGLTILFCSHQLHEAEQVCSDVAVLHQGRLVFAGPLQQAGVGRRMLRVEVDRRPEAVALLRERGLIAALPVDGEPVTLTDAARPADVARVLVQAGFALHGLTEHRPSLEEFYLRVTRGPGGRGTDEAA